MSKGPLQEEALRAYFLQAGYFVARGVGFVYEGFDVTDIDIWLYGRASSVSREIAIVDVKNKRTPQAIERIFWVKGLQESVGADRAIVATTDRRPEVKDFGRKLQVLVLDGQFLSKLESKDAHLATRLSEEEFNTLVSSYQLGKLDGDWKGRAQHCKALLSRGLSFDTCNEWLAQGRFFVEQAITKKSQAEVALRCLYLICAYLAVAVDYELREISFLESNLRSKVISEGFTYGSKGPGGMKKLIDLSIGLVSEYANDGRGIANQVKAKVEKSLSDIPTSILGEFFSRREVLSTLFTTSREFEALAMSRNFTPHWQASVEVRSMFGCLLDYWGIDRTNFVDTAPSLREAQASLLPTSQLKE